MNLARVSDRGGITLLEVLISIGILAVGLIGTLALIPAGGTYLQKAQTESRAAALIPNAFSTMEACGLFGQNAIDWVQDSATVNENEESLQGYPKYPRAIDPSSVEGATIAGFYMRDDPPWIAGVVPQGDASTVTVTATGPGGVTKTFVATPDANGKWRHAVSAYEFSLSEPPDPAEELMTVTNSGANPDTIDEYYDEWSFSVDNGTITVTPPATPARESDADAVTAYRHYRQRRNRGYTFGEALLDFTQPSFSPAIHRKNDSIASAQVFGVPLGFDRVRRQVTGRLWRYEVGHRQGRYQDWKRYDNYFRDGPVQPVIGSNWYESDNQGAVWVDSAGTPKADDEPDGIVEATIDYYRFTVVAGQEFELDWSATWSDYLEQSFSDNSPENAFFVEDQNGPLMADSISGQKARYTAVVDGPIYISVELLPEGNDDQDPKYHARLNNFGSGEPAWYRFDVTIFGQQQFALVDPLMASHLRLVAGGNAGHPLHRRIRVAAEFPQRLSGGGSIPFIINRLNWNIVADLAKRSDAVAVAESLCRPSDVVELNDSSGDELSAPEQRYESGELSSCHSAPVYDRYAGGWAYCEECGLQTLIKKIPLKRECDDRMSWMLTIQPEGEGSIQANWQAGNYFDVAIAVFQDRLFPVAGETSLEGEYAFDSWWSDETGLISIPIARSSGIDQDDIRRMFAAGSWILIAPKAASINQRIDWIQIQTCEFVREAGRTVARILPVSEPNTGANKGSSNLDSDPPNLVALVYQGVVAVSRRSIQITE
jgi:type II secretory pathway pseudopilin PulG